MSILFSASPRLLIRPVITAGLLLVFANFSSSADEERGVSFSIPGLDGGTIQLNEGKHYQLFVQSVAVKSLSASQLAHLIQFDEELRKNHDADSRQKSRALVIAIARATDVKGMLYLHEQFETHPERRNSIAEGLSYYAREKKLRDSDWRLLVRSLNVVEGKQAEKVIDAMLRFRRRANKSQWIRQLIIVGLTLDEKQAAKTIQLLEHWTGQVSAHPNKSSKEKLADWQNWFNKKYPEDPPAALPVDAKGSKWKYAELRTVLTKHHHNKVDLKQGELVFTKAHCFKCHRLGETGEKIGPNLSNIANKMQEKEILQAILFPSHFIPEEYPTTTIETKDAKTYTGMMGAVGPETLLILQLNGKKQFINKKNVKHILPNKKSAMPEKLLEGLSQEEIVQLFGYIRSFAKAEAVRFHKKK